MPNINHFIIPQGHLGYGDFNASIRLGYNLRKKSCVVHGHNRDFLFFNNNTVQRYQHLVERIPFHVRVLKMLMFTEVDVCKQ